MPNTKWYLGKRKHDNVKVYLEDFEWACDWYWSGGGVSTRDGWCHFDGCFLDIPDLRGHPLGNFVSPWDPRSKEPGHTAIDNGCSVWEPLEFFLNDHQYSTKQWWRIKDLFRQFYKLRDAAEVFQCGGHCTSEGRSPAELNKPMADMLNNHIRDVIIPEIRKAMDLTIEVETKTKKQNQ